jgi:hypothetical protein
VNKFIIAAYILILASAGIQVYHTDVRGDKNASAIQTLKEQRVKRTAELDARIDDLTARIAALEKRE